MKHDAFSITAMLLFTAFVIERITAGVMFLLPSSWRVDESGARNRKTKLMYFAVAGCLGLLALILIPEMRALHALDINAAGIMDFGLTWLLLVAGADRIAELVPDRSGSNALGTTARPIEIKGTVALLDGAEDSKSAAPPRR